MNELKLLYCLFLIIMITGCKREDASMQKLSFNPDFENIYRFDVSSKKEIIQNRGDMDEKTIVDTQGEISLRCNRHIGKNLEIVASLKNFSSRLDIKHGKDNFSQDEVRAEIDSNLMASELNQPKTIPHEDDSVNLRIDKSGNILSPENFSDFLRSCLLKLPDDFLKENFSWSQKDTFTVGDRLLPIVFMYTVDSVKSDIIYITAVGEGTQKINSSKMKVDIASDVRRKLEIETSSGVIFKSKTEINSIMTTRGSKGDISVSLKEQIEVIRKKVK